MLTYDKYSCFMLCFQLLLKYMKKRTFIFHFPKYTFANNIIKSNVYSDSKSFALPNSTKSSFSFMFVTFIHFSFTNVSNIDHKCCTISHFQNRWGISSL